MAVFGDITVNTTAAPGQQVWAGGASVLSIKNTGSVDVYVNVTGAHAAGDWFAIAPGEAQPFNAKQSQISKVMAYAASAGTLRVIVNAAN